MSDIAGGVETATKGHIGKFPIWLVALVIVGAGGALYMLYSRNAGGAAATPTADATTTDSGYTGDGLPPATADSSTDTSSGASNSLLSTNQAWLTRATAGVSLAFTASPTTVYSVLYNYINGNDWLQSQQKYIDRAIQDYGLPPEGTSGLGMSVADPATKPVTPVTKPPVVVVKNPAPKPVATPKPPAHTPKPPAKIAPKPPAKKVTKPAPVNVATAPIGAKVTLSHSYSGYVTATAANAGGKATVKTGTGTYYIFNRAARSHGEMVNVTRVKGLPGAWINP